MPISNPFKAPKRAKALADWFVKVLSGAERRAARDPEDTILKFPHLVQLDGYTCAVQSAAAVLQYYGLKADPDRLERPLKTNPEEGTCLYDVARHLRRRGLKARVHDRAGKKLIQEALDEGSPVLVSVDGNHASVVFGYGPENLYLADPAKVRVIFSWDEFMDRWDRFAIPVKGSQRHPGAGKRSHDVWCPVGEEYVEVPDYGGDWCCPSCDINIETDEDGAEHAACWLVPCPKTDEWIPVEAEDGEYVCTDCGEPIYVEDDKATHYVPYSVRCPVTNDDIEVEGSPGDTWTCPDCDGDIRIDEYGADHERLRFVTCPQSGEQVSFSDDGEVYECTDCDGTVRLVNGRSRHG